MQTGTYPAKRARVSRGGNAGFTRGGGRGRGSGGFQGSTLGPTLSGSNAFPSNKNQFTGYESDPYFDPQQQYLEPEPEYDSGSYEYSSPYQEEEYVDPSYQNFPSNSGSGRNMGSILENIEREQQARQAEIEKLEVLKRTLGSGGNQSRMKVTSFSSDIPRPTLRPSLHSRPQGFSFLESRGGFGAQPRVGSQSQPLPRFSTPLYDSYSEPQRGRGATRAFPPNRGRGGSFNASMPRVMGYPNSSMMTNYTQKPVISAKHKSGELRCTHCPARFANDTSLSQHVKMAHEVAQTKSVCNVCGKQFRDEPSMFQHRTAAHTELPEEEVTECEVCFKKFKTVAQKLQHKQGNHLNVNSSSSSGHGSLAEAIPVGGYHFCRDCNKNFKSRLAFNTHSRIVHGTETDVEVCRYCDEVFANTEIREHARLCEAKGDKEVVDSFQCPDCMEKFSTHQIYERHWHTSHNKSALIKCRICNKAFWEQVAKDQHELSHPAGAKQLLILECGKCDQLFEKKFTRQAHLASDHNTSETVRYCKYCDVEFPNVREANDHLPECSERPLLKPNAPGFKVATVKKNLPPALAFHTSEFKSEVQSNTNFANDEESGFVNL